MWWICFCSGPGLTRASYASLHAAGFPPILDHKGSPAEMIDPSNVVKVDLSIEERGRLKVNDIILQFMAFTRYVMYICFLFYASLILFKKQDLFCCENNVFKYDKGICLFNRVASNTTQPRTVFFTNNCDICLFDRVASNTTQPRTVFFTNNCDICLFDRVAGNTPQPRTVFFTFQFYRYPSVTSER